MADAGSVWARRFLTAALVQGAIMFLVTVALLIIDIIAFAAPNSVTSPEYVIATGSAGTWFTIGYLGYLLVPVIGTAVSALFYHYIEVVMSRPYARGRQYLAWAHLLLGNLALGAALALLMYGGYVGGAAMVPASLGGGGHDAQWVHDHVLGGLTPSISTLFLLGALGSLLGGIGFYLQTRGRTDA